MYLVVSRRKEEGRRKKEEGRKNAYTASFLALDILSLVRWTYLSSRVK
ncbi:MAG: hypothetical protein LH628_07985 [Microcoleus sp. CAN_BIN18]|nr:hypothetical protein [Microcoleus sp. CAN_BIN18]